jgi:hypothetical protein
LTDCESLPTCPFFLGTLPKMPAVASYLKMLYCRRNYLACSRYLVRKSLGGEHVPTDLFPDDIGRAFRIIHAADQGSTPV